MYLTQIIESINELAPSMYSVSGETYGLEFGRKTNISSIIIKRCQVGVNPTLNCIEAACRCKANLIITHHSLMSPGFEKIREIRFEKYRLLTKNNVWIYTIGDRIIGAREGISQSLCQALGLEPTKDFNVESFNGTCVPIGRIHESQGSHSLEDLIISIKENLNVNHVRFNGDLSSRVKKILVIGGEFKNISWFQHLLNEGVDAIITGELDPTIKCICSDLSISFLEISHYESDIIGMSKLRFMLSMKHPHTDFELFDEPVFIYH